jgi:hypothetical protein
MRVVKADWMRCEDVIAFAGRRYPVGCQHRGGRGSKVDRAPLPVRRSDCVNWSQPAGLRITA